MEEEINLESEENKSEVFEQHHFVTDPKQSVLRIDKFLMDKIENATRSKIQEAAKEGRIFVNGIAVKQNYKVKPHDEISIVMNQPPREIEILAEDIPLDIVYEDDDVIIVNKKAGMVVHPAYGNFDGTLVNALTFHFKNLPNQSNHGFRPGLIHRLDKNTSGIMAIAKTDHAMTHIAKQFFDRTTYRRYYALVWGSFKENEGTVTGNIGRSLKNRKVMDVFPEGDFGKHAVTHYKVLYSYDYVTLVECRLETGRTHQIRAHMKHIGHPLFGDVEYGGNKILRGTRFTKYRQFVDNCFKLMPNQSLHAKELGFNHPKTEEWTQFNSELPDYFQELLDRWENYLTNRKD
jgi:23S rRNA pseudouridine1911/1915/1917 synthase